jgi:hypothetical protein
MNEGEFLKKVCLNVFASAKRARFVGVVDQDGKLLLGKYRHRSEKDSSALLIESSIFCSHYLIPTINKNRDANKFRKSMSYDIIEEELEEPCFELLDLPGGDTMKLIITPLTNRHDRYLCVYLELVPLSCAESIKAPIEHHDKIDSLI